MYSDYEIVVLVSSLLLQLRCHLSLETGRNLELCESYKQCFSVMIILPANKAIWQLNLTTKSFEFILLSVIQYSNEGCTCYITAQLVARFVGTASVLN